MKKLSKIKLNQFSKNELDQRKMNALKGGCVCARYCNDCGTACSWVTDLGATTADVEVGASQVFMGSDMAAY